MKKVKIYTVDYCPYCSKAKELLTSLDIPFTDVDITDNEIEERKMIGETYSIEGRVTVPQIFIGKKRIGGYDNLKKLVEDKKLFELLKD
ncbi:MAG: glutaredoxin domain-containing protein [Candidatus Gastranaerophilales bacterium]|nr:glutaredoxin domain-containing protein [Candidatus Gastranaerophilales bacterium]